MAETTKCDVGDEVRLPDGRAGQVWASGPPQYGRSRAWVALGTRAVLVLVDELRPLHDQPELEA